MIVIDVGCMTRGPEESVIKLMERFAPDVLLAFDPDPELVEGVALDYQTVGYVQIVRRRACAWVEDGEVQILEDGMRTRIATEEETGVWVPAFDLATLIWSLPKPIVLKLDCEGAEVPLLEHLAEREMDAHLELILVEWHCETCGTGGGEHAPECDLPVVTKVGGLRCPVEEWA